MLTTIEQKLSAIKAINEEKDKLDQYLIKLHAMDNSSIEAVTLHLGDAHADPKFLITEDTSQELRAVLELHFAARRQELIHDAEELMK